MPGIFCAIPPWGLLVKRFLTHVLRSLLAAALAGCFQESSFPIRPGDFQPLSIPGAADAGDPPAETTRQWLVRAAEELSPLLEPSHRRYMTTEDMSDENGRPRDVSVHLERPSQGLNSIILNYYGFLHTAQGASTGWATDQELPAWPGFEPVWIPVDDEVQLSGRLGLARDPSQAADASSPLTADCIVILPGLFGDNGVKRTRDLAAALRDHGLHVLALELRGHGQTDRRFPNVFYTFGALECQDLLRVSQWLQDTYRCVRRTGLVGTCWGGNLGMLAAWFDGRPSDDPSIGPILSRYLDPPPSRRHYTAGILAFSALLRWEELMYETETPQDALQKPIVYFFQRVIRQRMELKRHPSVSGKLRVLIDYEFCRSQLTSQFPIDDAYLFLRILPYRDRPCPPKMESARVPVLLIHAANDMFASPQAIADLMAETRNPNVAALILRGGGHVGFFPYHRAFTYSLVLNFFDPKRGPAAGADPRPAPETKTAERPGHHETPKRHGDKG